MSFNSVKNCRYGPMIYNVNDAYVGRSLELYGEFSEGEADLFRQLVVPGDLVVEVGANIGTHTVFLAKSVGPTGAVVAIEPQRVVFQALCGNIAINSLANVLCLNSAAGEKPGSILVPTLDPTAKNNFGGLPLGGATAGETVPMITIDSLNLGRCKLLKVDVEGMEHAVLTGAAQTIARTRPFLYVENDRHDRSAELMKLIDSMEYDMYPHAPPLFNPNNFARNSENVFGRIVSLNLLCAHRSVNLVANGLKKIEVKRV